MKKSNILFLVCSLFLASCGFEDMPFDKYDQEFVFSTDVKAEGYVLSVYTGLPYNKLFADLGGIKVIEKTIAAFCRDDVAKIIIPCSEKDEKSV